MEFGEKLQALRKEKGLTQDELATALIVSRTAISKWESGRGYPSIESLKMISKYFSISVDDLLSGEELIEVAEQDNVQKVSHIRDLVFGLLDVCVAMFLFLPFFGQTINGVISEVGLLRLTMEESYIKGGYFFFVFITIVFGILELALQNVHFSAWGKLKTPVSVSLSIISALIYILSRQPYAASFSLFFLIIKGILLIKRK